MKNSFESIPPAGQEISDSEKRRFEEQFNRVEEIKLSRGSAEAVDVRPEKEKTDVPVFFAPAWGLTPKTYEYSLETLYLAGRRAISLSHPRWGGGKPPAGAPAERYPREELRKAATILEVLEKKGVKKTDAIGHSEGALNLLIAASLRPEQFRNIVLLAPAGLIGKDDFSRLLKGFAAQSKRSPSLDAVAGDLRKIDKEETSERVGAQANKDVLAYAAKNTLRALKEAKGIAGSEVHQIINELHKKGVGIAVMATVDDPVFPMDRMQANFSEKRRAGDKIEVDGFLSLRGNHGMADSFYIKAAENLLEALEKKKSRPL